jgi:Na+/H+ antiporter NhaA
MLILGIIIGFICGVATGISVFCFCTIVKENDKHISERDKESKKNE